jgi:Mce-associated membrane protein
VPATSDDARADADEDTDEPDTDGSATTRVELSKTPTPASAGPRGKARPKVKVSTIKPQPTRPAPKRPTATAPGTPGGARRRRFFGWRTVGVLAVIAAVVGALAGVAAARPGVDLSDNQAFVDPSLTSQVSAQAKSRICSVFGVNYAKLDDWERTAKANVTGEASEAFTRYAGAVRDAIGQTGLTEGGVDCRVDTVGVRDISGGDATLVANLILSQTQGQQATGSGTKRYQVGMRQVNGQWLISSFSDF